MESRCGVDHVISSIFIVSTTLLQQVLSSKGLFSLLTLPRLTEVHSGSWGVQECTNAYCRGYFCEFVFV